mgnify:CR=1 FL=1
MLLMIPLLGALLSGFICGMLGYYVQRYGVTTLSFTIAHSALAGAAISLVLGFNTTLFTLFFAVASALLIGYLTSKSPIRRELICMGLFSLLNAVAILMLYMSSTNVLSTVQLSTILWGSVLAITCEKIIAIVAIAATFLVYAVIFKPQIDAILFDQKLAEAEGVNVKLHSTILLLFVGSAIAIILRITGGFLVFSLLYNPVASALLLSKRANIQQLISPILGSSVAIAGLFASFMYNLPVGASIALLSSVTLLLSYVSRVTINYMLAQRSVRSKEDIEEAFTVHL